MQTKNINHRHDPQVHQNCHLTEGAGMVALPSDRMYGSTSALYQRPDLTNVNLSANVINKSSGQSIKSTSSIPKLLTPLRVVPNNNRSSFHSHNRPEQTSGQPLGQTNSCTSTPLLSSGVLRRQTSLGLLEGQTPSTSSSQNCRTSDGGFGAFQQRIRAMLLPAKDSCKPKVNSMNTNDVSSVSQSSNSNESSQNIDIHRPSVSHNSSPYSTINPSIETFNGLEEENDSFHIRDVCSKWFGQKQSPINQTFSSQMASAVNKPSLISDSPKLSHNMKTTLLDKVMTKDSICQNPYTNCVNLDNQLTIDSISSPTHSSDLCLSERQQTSSDCELISVANDRHVVIVSGLECDTNRTTCLTVRSDLSPNDKTPEISPNHTNSAYHSIQPNSASNPLNLHKVNDGSAESTGSQEHNYKSSSDSGRGTMRCREMEDGVKTRSPDGVSPLDLTSLDSDQSTQGMTTSVWVDHSVTQGTGIENNSSNETIEKMQRELQRILEDNHSVQSSEVEVDDLSRNFKTRLSVVNESDSWTSNTPSQTPHPPQTGTTVKYLDSKMDTKCSQISSNGVKNVSSKAYNTSKKCITSEKQTIVANKQIIANEKHKYPALRPTKTPQMSNSCPKRKTNERSVYNSSNNKSKVRSSHSHIKSKERFINLIDCDIASTTTARDSTYADDLSSEYTANTSVCQRDDVFAFRKQLQGLENMYSEIIEMMGSRVKTDSTHRRRKVCRSVSSVVSGRSSVTSRGTRDLYYRRSKPELRRHKCDETHSSRRLKRLESHVVTLARSVAQLSTDMRYNQSVSQEVENLRQDIELIRDQMLALKQTISANGFGMSSKAYHPSTGHICGNGRRNPNPNHIINPNKVEKLKRFFGDEPPLLRQFLKKLGYEKYARNFETEKIGITELPYLSEERMMKLGIPLGPRMRIIQESHSQLKPNTNTDHYSVYAVI